MTSPKHIRCGSSLSASLPTGWCLACLLVGLAVQPTAQGSEGRDRARMQQLYDQALAGQITVDPDHPAWLKRKGGTSLFLCGPGDPEDFLYRGVLKPDGTRDGDQMALIEKLKGTGANCIYLQAVRSHGGDGDSTHNPFINHNPAEGLNSKVLDQWEQWFVAMDQAGLVIYMFIYDDSTEVWGRGDTVGPEEKAFLHVLVDRFEHHKNLIWCVAEEYREALSVMRAKAIASEIRAADDYGHVIAIHKNHGLDFSEFADCPNIDQFAIQYNVATPGELHDGLLRAWRQARGRYNLNMSECADHGTGRDMRRKNWASAMAGAYVMVLGMDIASTPMEDLLACGAMVRFFEATDFAEMAPHDELAAAATKYVLARPGRSYIAYSWECAERMGLRDVPTGRYEVLWLDCVTGRQFRQTVLQSRPADGIWAKPRGFGNEVALYVRRVAAL